MTVRQLIEILEKQNQENDVFCSFFVNEMDEIGESMVEDVTESAIAGVPVTMIKLL